MAMPGLQDDLVRRVAAANPKTCVLINAGSPVAMDWADEVAALGQIWFPGEQGGEAVADVLLGEAEPGGRLPTTLPRRLEDTPAFDCYPGADGHVAYGEGLKIGYRHYDAGGPEPMFCFGHGLSYTRFELSEPTVTAAASSSGQPLPAGLEGPSVVRVGVTVTNVGERAGTEVVQCYVHGTTGAVEQQLKGACRVRLERGESRRVEIDLPERAFANWDGAGGAFVTKKGTYELRIGRSSRDLPLRERVTLS
jgi:beta-glucosidase